MRTMIRTVLLTSAAVIALAAPVHAEGPQPADTQTSFSQAIKSIKGWFGADTPEAAPQADVTTAASDDDTLQVPPQVDPAAIEPAAGGFDEDMLQVPPPYMGNQSNNSMNNGTPRATSFDNDPAMAAFGDAQGQSPADIANIAPAAGGDEMDPAKLNCEAILKAADSAQEGEVPDTALIEACEVPQANAPANEPVTEPAQPAFDVTPAPQPGPLPATQPAAGEPPVGGAVMPGGNPAEQPSKPQ